MTPKRIQRKRTRGWKMPPNTVYVGRPTKWGNPYVVGGNYSEDVFVDGKLVYINSWSDINAETAVQFYEEAIKLGYKIIPFTMDEIKRELRGKDLACWCKEGEVCHADVLLRLANEATE